MLTRTEAESESRADGCVNPTSTPRRDVEPIQYIVTFPEAERHYAHVAATVPTDGNDEVELMMAVWTPGSWWRRRHWRPAGVKR